MPFRHVAFFIKCRARGLVSRQLGSAAKISLHAAPSSQRLIQMQHRITASSKSTGFKKKNRRKSDGS